MAQRATAAHRAGPGSGLIHDRPWPVVPPVSAPDQAGRSHLGLGWGVHPPHCCLRHSTSSPIRTRQGRRPMSATGSARPPWWRGSGSSLPRPRSRSARSRSSTPSPPGGRRVPERRGVRQLSAVDRVVREIRPGAAGWSKFRFCQHTGRGSVGITGSITDEDHLTRSATPRLGEVRKLERNSSEILQAAPELANPPRWVPRAGIG